MESLTQLREENILNHIYLIRGERVMLDVDLAILYGIETRAHKQAVRRNIHRFPGDFMMELTDEEIHAVVSQNVIPSRSYFGGARPFAFTEQGVAMLSGVINSEQAIQVNIAIMRTFVHLRKMLSSHKELLTRIENLENKFDEKFRIVFKAIKILISDKKPPSRRIGFKSYD